MADPIAEAQVAAAVLKKSWALICAVALFAGGVALAETYEHTFRLKVWFVSIEGMGQRLLDVRPQLQAAARDLKQCGDNTAAAQTALAQQSAAVTAWQAQGVKATAAADAAVQAAASAGAQADKRVSQILAQRGSTCADIDALRKEY